MATPAAAALMHERHLGLGGQWRDRGGGRREDDPGQQLHMVAGDQFLRQPLADIGFRGVVAA